jgi:hypothetical protein
MVAVHHEVGFLELVEVNRRQVFLADFIALPTAFRVNVLTIVFMTTLPMPPICLVLFPRWGCLTWELPQGTSGAVLCSVV